MPSARPHLPGGPPTARRGARYSRASAGQAVNGRPQFQAPAPWPPGGTTRTRRAPPASPISRPHIRSFQHRFQSRADGRMRHRTGETESAARTSPGLGSRRLCEPMLSAPINKNLRSAALPVRLLQAGSADRGGRQSARPPDCLEKTGSHGLARKRCFSHEPSAP